MSKIQTAKQFLLDKGFPGFANHSLCKSWMIEFAKLHVTAALKAASEKAQVYADEGGYSEFVDEQSILNSYPLEKIK